MGKKHKREYQEQESQEEQGQSIEKNCVDCKNTFELTAGEQSFYKERGLFEPKRCKPCRDIKRGQRG